MAEPLGFEYYRDNYSTEALWDMLITQGDPTSVALSSTVWATARGRLANAREALNADVSDLTSYWRGSASEEFQDRMSLVVQYSASTEFLMEQAETTYLPDIAAKLAAAQACARGENPLGEDLDPENDIADLEEWMEQVKGLDRAEIAELTSSGWNTNTDEHAAWRAAHHDELARIIADLGALYAYYANTVFAEPPPSAPEPMPGTPTFRRSAGGVFANDPTDAPAERATGPVLPTGGNADPVAPVPDEDVEDEEEASPWTYSSYDDFDEPSGGLAGGGATALPAGGNPLGGGAAASGAGSPGAGPGTVGGVPGRGVNAVGGTVPPGGRGGATARGGAAPNTAARPGAAGRSSVNAPGSSRRSTDEGEEEETTPRESKYVEAENVFSAPFDPAAGPAHEGPKHQRAWDKEQAAWEERRREEEP